MKKSKKLLSILVLLVILTGVLLVPALADDAPPAPTADSTGASYAQVKTDMVYAAAPIDTSTADSTASAIKDVAKTANQAQFSANFVWVMITGFMVFFFQCGFAMVETGFIRGKNAAHTITMNFMVFLVGAVGYFLTGFAIQFGGSGGAAGLGTGGSVAQWHAVDPRLRRNTWLQRFLPAERRYIRRRHLCSFLLPNGFHGHDVYNPNRFYG